MDFTTDFMSMVHQLRLHSVIGGWQYRVNDIALIDPATGQPNVYPDAVTAWDDEKALMYRIAFAAILSTPATL